MLSVIIPVKRNEPMLHIIIDSIPSNYEVLVVGKNSKINPKRDYKFIKSNSSNRAVLMNIGANHSTQPILLFLHPDTIINKQTIHKISKLNKNFIGGGVIMAFYPNSYLLKLVAFGSNIRMIFFKMIYGDQCMFIRKKHFNGFKNLQLCEDVEFSKRLRKKGKLVFFKSCKTNARRLIKNGIIKQTIINQLIIILFNLGVSSKTLRRIYGK